MGTRFRNIYSLYGIHSSAIQVFAFLIVDVPWCCNVTRSASMLFSRLLSVCEVAEKSGISHHVISRLGLTLSGVNGTWRTRPSFHFHP
jgi:hypothetical protein